MNRQMMLTESVFGPLFLLQIPLSVWWLRRFRFGPVEWLWRSLTYVKAQPMRLAAPVEATT